MNYWRKVFVSACIGILPVATFGAASPPHSASPHSVNNNPRVESSVNYEDNSAWHATIAAYLWAIGMQGSLSLKGHSTDVSESFSDLLAKLEAAGMFWVDAGKGKFGAYFNGIYTKISSEATKKRIKTKATDTFAIYAAGITYIAFDRVLQQEAGDVSKSFVIQPYLGVRIIGDKIGLDITGLPAGPLSVESDVGWAQPLLGARFIYQFSKNGRISFASDVAYASSKNNGFNAVVLLGYQNLFGYQSLGIHLGYRYLLQHYEENDNQYKYDMNIYGPILGFSFSF